LKKRLFLPLLLALALGQWTPGEARADLPPYLPTYLPTYATASLPDQMGSADQPDQPDQDQTGSQAELADQLDESPTFSDETDSVLVEVPVEVLSGGRPVAGLRPEDFEIFDNGREQKVLGVDVVDRRQSRYDTDLPVVARRHFLLLFDLSFTSPAAVARAREAALETVEQKLDPSDLVGVATFRLQEGVRLLLGFSPDRAQVRVTLDALEERSDLTLRPDPLRLYIGQVAAKTEVSSALRPDGPAAREEAYAHLQHLIDRESASRSRRDVAVLSASLGSLARLMRGVSGRKHLLFFSEGFDSGLLLGNEGSDREGLQDSIRSGQLGKVDSDAYFGSRATLDLLGRLTKEMRRADCSLHTVDTSPLGQGKGKDGLFLLARDTGAVFFENFNRLGPAFEDLLERTQITYVITYRPDELAGDGSYRKLKVKLEGGLERRLNAKLSYRPGYYDDEVGALADEERRLLLAERLLDRRSGPIQTRVHALPTGEMVHGKRFVPVVVEVAGPSFLGGATATTESSRRVVLDAQIFVYALNEDGGIVDFFSQAIPFDLARHGPALQRRGFKLFASMLLPTGRFTLRALVRNAERGHVGVASKRLSVAKATSALRVPKALVDPEWLLVRADRRDLADLGPSHDTLDLLRRAQQRSPEKKVSQPEKASEQTQLYLNALAGLTNRPWHEALDELEEFEQHSTASDPQARAPRLGRAELAAARALAQNDIEALWPLICVHHDLYFRHRARHQPFLELQSRLLVRALADLAGEAGGDALRVAAAQALASIGSVLLYERRSAGFELLEKSLALDPGNEPAHLSLAAYYEKFGGPYVKAVEWLDQLVLRRPDSREGRLRLAINLLRLDSSAAANWPHAQEDAVAHFEQLLRDPEDDWISSLAAQELARTRRSAPGRAAVLLEELLARRPDDPELLIQLTYLYDRLEEPVKSRALAERLSRKEEGPRQAEKFSARGRYNRWTSDSLVAERRDLMDGAASRIAALERVLLLAEGSAR